MNLTVDHKTLSGECPFDYIASKLINITNMLPNFIWYSSNAILEFKLVMQLK